MKARRLLLFILMLVAWPCLASSETQVQQEGKTFLSRFYDLQALKDLVHNIVNWMLDIMIDILFNGV